MLSVGDLDPVRVTRGQIDAVFGKSFAWYPVVGNHELDNTASDPAAGDMAYLREYFNTNLKGKVNPGPQGTRETTYSFDAGDVHIAVINEYWDGQTEPGSDAKGGGVVEPLRAWLKTDLQASRKPWKLVVGHEPAYPQPDKDWGAARHAEDNLTAHPADRDAFWSLLDECRVAAYLCGHTHRYSRYQPPHSKVWQIDVAQARGNEKEWKYDTFVIATADASGLKFETYRSLTEPRKFALTDRLALPAVLPPAARAPAVPAPAAPAPAAK
jgi:hypothetical protein